MRHHRRSRIKAPPELDITAFMNLMVVLVPFLLITVAFTKMTMIDLEIPSADNSTEISTEKKFVSIIIRNHQIETLSPFGDVTTLKKDVDGNHDIAGLSAKLQEIKAASPTLRDAIIRPEDNIPYELMITIMDATMAYSSDPDQPDIKKTLFPNISLGDPENI